MNSFSNQTLTLHEGTTAEAADTGYSFFVSDEDNDTVTFSVDDDRFEIIITNPLFAAALGLAAIGTLRVKTGQSFDFETEPTVTVTITATDATGRTDIETVTINITNTPSAPVVSIIGTQVLTLISGTTGEAATDTGHLVLASDEDNDAVTFSINDARFEIAADGRLQVKANQTFDFANEPSVTLTVTATDATGSTDTAQVTITVTSADEKPSAMILSATEASLEEGTYTNGYELANISFTDDGQGTNRATVPTDSIFEIRRDTELWLKAGTTLDFEATGGRSHTVTLTPSVTGTGTAPAAQTFTLTVADVDEKPTAMSLSRSSVTLNEGITSARKIADITFTDDALGTNTATITGTDRYFEIRNGTELWLKGRRLDHETDSRHNVWIHADASGTGSQPASQLFRFSISDADISIRSIDDVRFNDSIPIRTTVANANAVVTGATGGAIYTLSGGDADLFNINSATGIITPRSTINPFSTRIYELIVTASARDGDPLETASQHFTIEINKGPSGHAHLSTQYGRSITSYLPTDWDGDTITAYRLLSTPDPVGTVTLDTTAGTLTYTANPTYWGLDRFVIRATDEHGASGDTTYYVNITPRPWRDHTLRLGTSGDDTLTGADGSRELFFGGPGNDTMSGGTGADGYIIEPNSGNDTIIDPYSTTTGYWYSVTTVHAKNNMKFVNISSNQIHLDIVGDDLVIGITDSGAAAYGVLPTDNRVTIQDWEGQFAEFLIGDTIRHSTTNFLNWFDKDYGTSGDDDWGGGDWGWYPITLDLDGDGLEFIDNQSVSFDWNRDGTDDLTSWVGADDGLLVYDADNDNQVTVDEITFTQYIDGAQSDLAGLVFFDTDSDGWLDSDDTDFAKFKVWQDGNGNGTVDDGELQALSAHNIARLRLSPTPDSGQEMSHITLIATSIYELTDGSEQLLGDVAFTFLPGEDIL